MSAAEKKLKIQVGVVKRLRKEVVYYGREAVKQQERIERLRSEGADDAVLRKQTQVLEESQRMTPDTQRRLREAEAQLASQVAALRDGDDEDDVKLAPIWKDACELLE